MKTISKLLLAVCFLSVVDANAELKRFSFKYEKKFLLKTHTLEIKEGESIKSTNPNTSEFQYYYKDRLPKQVTVEFEGPDGKSSIKTDLENLVSPIVGPAKIIFDYGVSFEIHESEFHFIYDLQKTSTSSSTDNTSNLPSNTVVIPTDASGPVEIIMESSKDLVNWTRAEPGTYGADTPKRFFRVRAVVKP